MKEFIVIPGAPRRTRKDKQKSILKLKRVVSFLIDLIRDEDVPSEEILINAEICGFIKTVKG